MNAKIQVKNHQFELFLEAQKIQQRIKEMATELEVYAADKELCFVIVLNGALFFASDLILNYTKPCSVQTIKCKSYEGMESTGKIKFELPFSAELENKHVVILEDIIDTGTTLEFLLKEIQQFNPSSVKVCSLLFKPEALKHTFNIDYVGFEIPNLFVLGYGLDFDGYGRNYKDIYQIVKFL
jgi:hypoxanthine phosphoribosyltransferase